MKTARFVHWLAPFVFLTIVPGAWAVDDGQTSPRFNRADLVSSNTSADIIPLTSGSGNVKGFQCEYGTGVFSSKLRISFYVDGGTAQSAPLYLFPVVDSPGSQYVTAFIPMNVRFQSSIRVLFERLGISGTGGSGCVVSWGLD